MKIPYSIKLFGIIGLVCLVALSMISAATAADPNVCRDLPTSANPGDTITVTLDITLDGADKTVIEDNVPAGWNVSNPSGSGFIVNPEKVSWIDVNAALGVEQLTYDVTIPGDAALGTYSFYGVFDLALAAPGLQPIDCETQMEVVEVVVEPSSGGGSGSGSGGGGGSGATGEAFENIAFKEVKTENIVGGLEISYTFYDEQNAIEYINFSALRNYGRVSTTVEVLKDKSAIVDESAPGVVYSNLNIWVGKSGFATEDNIADPVIGFCVAKVWLIENGIDENSIALYRHSEGKWNTLNTMKVGEDDSYIYFEAKTPGFSPFAITGDTTSVGSEEEEVTGTDANPLTEGAEDRTTSYKGANRTKSTDAGSSKERIITLLSFATIIGSMGYIKRDDISKYLKKK